MKTKRNHSGRRSFPIRRPSGSPLLHSFILFSLLLTQPSACLITSCSHIGDPGETEDINVKTDSCRFHLHLDINSGITDGLTRVGNLDLLIYDSDGLGSLETWLNYDSMPDSISFEGAKRTKTVVAIANSPRSFSRRAIERFDSIELLSYDFEEDSPDEPLMSGMCSLLPERSGHVSLTPLMSRIQLGEISNTMKGYARLEDPRIYLENANSYAELLKNSGFRPSEFMPVKEKQRLPYDIGIFAQRPGSELFCYPNDTPESTMGSPQTSLVLECEINGSTCRFPVVLGSIGRNQTLHVDISVAGPELYESKVY